MGEYEGANQADRWRKRMRQGRRWRLSANVVIWTFIVLLMTVSIMLIANKASDPASREKRAWSAAASTPRMGQIPIVIVPANFALRVGRPALAFTAQHLADKPTAGPFMPCP
ncbi:hypothetical protein FJW10_02605 [Mesorhizobium sp. B4-1-1]|nr:hypothetical protein FJW10_02605 [Mesorhizobium sp. B4-1-1]